MSDIRILIVEDDPFIAMDIESAVQDSVGDTAELLVVSSLAAASKLVDSSLCCALLDIDVVGGKTFDVASGLLELGTPFAFVSGSTPNDVPPHLRDVRFVRKPFATHDIVSFVEAVVSSRS